MTKKKPVRVTLPPCIELDARLTIVQAADLHRTLVARVASGGPVAVDGSRVEEIDTSILQLLTSLWRTSLERGISCTWRGVSDVLRRRAALIGVAEMLHFPE
jgi:anti-anti-sigma regulatory factor